MFHDVTYFILGGKVMKKMLKSCLAVLVMIPVLVGMIGAKTVQAEDDVAETAATVTIHKRVFDEGSVPADKVNTGEEMSEFGGTPLPGAEFTVYDVTDEYYQLIQGSTQTATITNIQKAAEATIPSYAVKKTSIVTNADGQAAFADLALKNAKGQYNVYLFVETKTPTTVTVTKRAVPIVLAMPIYKVDAKQQPTDTINTAIQLYPKNISAQNTKVLENSTDFSDVTIGDKTYKNVTTGDVLKYALTVNIPASIINKAEGASFVIKDTPSAGLSLVDKTVTVGTLKEGTDYTIAYADGGFTVTLNLASDAVQALAGNKLLLKYDMKLTATVKPDDRINNKASVKIDDGPEQEIVTPPTPVVTGGYQFTKTDAQTGLGLTGAEFIVTNDAQTSFAKFSANPDGSYSFSSWTTNKAEATKVQSGKDGNFSVLGLKNGTYVLNETKTPSEKYILLKDGTIKFDVKAGAFEQSKVTVPNTAKGLLPSTGGAGIYLFLVVGSVLMVGTTIWYKQSKAKAEI